MFSTSRAWIRVGLLGIGFLGAPACGAMQNPPDQADLIYVGTVDNSDSMLAVVVRANQVTAYVCGGAESYATMTRWFSGTIGADGAITLQAAQGSTFRANANGSTLTGTVTTETGMSYSLHATSLAQGSLGGLFATVDEGCRTGVIVQPMPGAEEPRVQGTWCNSLGDRSQVTPIRPMDLTANGLSVQVQRVAGLRRLYVSPVIPALP